MAWKDVSARVKSENGKFIDMPTGLQLDVRTHRIRKVPIYRVEDDARPPNAVANWAFIIEQDIKEPT